MRTTPRPTLPAAPHALPWERAAKNLANHDQLPPIPLLTTPDTPSATPDSRRWWVIALRLPTRSPQPTIKRPFAAPHHANALILRPKSKTQGR